jgi:uncharacterized protein YqhQ
MSDTRFSYGGQAVLEGVMMRGQRQATVAVQAPSGTIVTKHFPLHEQRRARWERLPLVRGVILLWDMLNLGMRALNFSASVAGEEEEDMPAGATLGALVLALVFAVGLFFVLPLLVASFAGTLGASLLLREVLEGTMRLGLIVGYIVLVGRLPDIQRVFAYHGAEHKTVNAYEAGAPLTEESVRRFSLIHPRCGTSFLIIVAVISFVVFLLVGGFPFWVKLLSRVVFIPLIAALAYEVLRLSAANYHRPWVQALVAPSLAFQKLTTREPDLPMLTVAITALQAVLVADGVMEQERTDTDEAVLAVSA